MSTVFLFFEWLYAALLHLYPASFRAVYEQQMRLTFRDACRVAYHKGGLGELLSLWLPTLLDLFKSALEERAQQGEMTMSKARLISFAGPLTILVGLMWVMAALGEFIFQFGRDGDEAFLGLFTFPFFFSFIPMLFALIGTRLRFHPNAGSLGKLGLALSVAGCAGVIIGIWANILLNGQLSWLNFMTVACLLSIRIGYFLFGIDTLRYRLLPRWNLLPLLLGATVVLSLSFDWFAVPAFIPWQWVSPFMHFVITGTCWVLLGIAMLGLAREPEPAAAVL